jgi:hypothetical protein
VGSLQNVAVINSSQVVPTPVPLLVLLELLVLLPVLVADVPVVVWAATGNVAKSSAMMKVSFIPKPRQMVASPASRRARYTQVEIPLPANVSV